MMVYLRKNSKFEKQNIDIFQEELQELGVTDPTIIAFGSDAYGILLRNFNNQFRIIRIPHYSNYTSKEKYRVEVKRILNY